MRRRRRSAVALAVLCGVQFLDVLGVTSAITAVPAILRGLRAPAVSAPVVTSAYAACFGGLLVLGARLGDRFGPRRVLAVGTVVFIVAGVLGGTAPGIAEVVVARAVQGAAAATSVPCALRLLLLLPAPGGSQRGHLAAWSATGAVAGALGFLVGGTLVDLLGWRAVFWLNPPVGVVLLVAALLVVPAPPGDHAVRLDATGAALLLLAVCAVTTGCSLLEDPAERVAGAVLVTAGVTAALALVVQQRRVRQPLLPRAAIASAGLRAGVLVSFVNTFTTSSAAVLATLLLQRSIGVPAGVAGALLLPFSGAVVAGSALSAAAGRRLPARVLASAGLSAIGAGDLLLAATAGSASGVVGGTIVVGAGLGVASVAANEVGTGVEETVRGAAAGLLNTGAQVGTALGTASLVVLAQVVGVQPAGTALAWAVAGGIALVTAAFVAPRRRAPAP